MDNEILRALLVFGCLLAIALIGLFTSNANAMRLNLTNRDRSMIAGQDPVQAPGMARR